MTPAFHDVRNGGKKCAERLSEHPGMIDLLISTLKDEDTDDCTRARAAGTLVFLSGVELGLMKVPLLEHKDMLLPALAVALEKGTNEKMRENAVAALCAMSVAEELRSHMHFFPGLVETVRTTQWRPCNTGVVSGQALSSSLLDRIASAPAPPPPLPPAPPPPLPPAPPSTAAMLTEVLARLNEISRRQDRMEALIREGASFAPAVMDPIADTRVTPTPFGKRSALSLIADERDAAKKIKLERDDAQDALEDAHDLNRDLALFQDGKMDEIHALKAHIRELEAQMP
jgi:hypothetical protein